jgi:hypothetical protein
MSFWQIFGKTAVSDQGETIQRLNDFTSVSNKGIDFSHLGCTTIGSDGSVFTQMGNLSSDGSSRIDSTATELGAESDNRQEDSKFNSVILQYHLD